jgi:hypothetical protein
MFLQFLEQAMDIHENYLRCSHLHYDEYLTQQMATNN